MNRKEKIRMIRKALAKLETMEDMVIDILFGILCK